MIESIKSRCQSIILKYENKNRNNLDIWDEQLIRIGIKIFNYRREFIEKINEKIEKIEKQMLVLSAENAEEEDGS